MLQKVSPEPMENSSGYVSNTNSMKPPPVKYATVGRSRPGGVKRTSSLVVSQPVVPPPAVYKAPPRQRELRKLYKNDLSRPSSQASRSSGGSGAGRRPSSRSSREAMSERASRQRAGSTRRSSYSKVRRPESRTSSKALILRRRESSRRDAPQRSSSIRSGREARDVRPDSRASQASQRPAGKQSRSIFGSWKPRITLRRSKSLQVKPEPVKKREIRFGDEYEPSVIMMKGVEHRRSEAGARSMSARADAPPSGRRLTQTLNRPPRRSSPPTRSQRASSADVTRRLEPLGEAPQESPPRARRYRPNERAGRAPSELSSSSPRAPVWRADSDGSLSDTMTARSRGSTVRSARHGDRYAARSQRSRTRVSESSGDRKNAGVMGFLRRKFSLKPRDKPSPAPVKKRERASSSSLSSLERPARHSKLKTAKSHEVLTVEPGRAEVDTERTTYRSLPRTQHRSGAGGTSLSRRLSSLGWATVGRPTERSHSFRDEPRNNERLDLPAPVAPPKATNETSRGRPRAPPEEEQPIQPIIQQRRALSQPSLFHPAEEREPPQEPFTHYANLPFQLSARHRSSPDLTEPLATAPAARAASQPSLVVAGRASRRSSASSSSLESPDERRHSSRGRSSAHGAHRKGILKRQRSTERRHDGVKNVNVTRDLDKHGRQRQHGVLHDIAHNIKNVFRHRKSSDRQPSEGRAVVPSGDSVVSERYVNVTNSHEEHESGRREEEVHHLGSVSNEEVQRAIRDGVDARRLVQRQVSAGSGGGGAVVDPRAPQRRLLHQHGRSWRTVDTDDLRETSRRDRHGELRTESAHTHQHEEYHDAKVRPLEGVLSGRETGDV
ncbi:serine/arginine repetitive matrix protein 1-like [Amphibalanus amphitrite]|uniref:serine/arginine repetitive matrix protein 1-like n=1 Tax=Amphibalanus amphitrite TaxID=1232801 RepID=UPI001C90A716|nr:serine/arginine repetitive matrix protein 1-like [Amphibalanus amphitrite]